MHLTHIFLIHVPRSVYRSSIFMASTVAKTAEGTSVSSKLLQSGSISSKEFSSWEIDELSTIMSISHCLGGFRSIHQEAPHQNHIHCPLIE